MPGIFTVPELLRENQQGGCKITPIQIRVKIYFQVKPVNFSELFLGSGTHPAYHKNPGVLRGILGAF